MRPFVVMFLLRSKKKCSSIRYVARVVRRFRFFVVVLIKYLKTLSAGGCVTCLQVYQVKNLITLRNLVSTFLFVCPKIILDGDGAICLRSARRRGSTFCQHQRLRVERRHHFPGRHSHQRWRQDNQERIWDSGANRTRRFLSKWWTKATRMPAQGLSSIV